jgi:hypothetical protein
MRIQATHPTQPRRVYPDKTALKLRGAEFYFDSIIIGEKVTLAVLEVDFEDVEAYPVYNGVAVEQDNLSSLVQEAIETKEPEVPLEWSVGEYALVGTKRTYAGVLYECIQQHLTQADWAPPATPALWKKVAPPPSEDEVPEEGETPEIPEWVQPTGAHDAYAKDAQVMYEGAVWMSTVDNNTWKPGVYGWERQKEES